MTISVLVVDDHTVFAETLAAALLTNLDMEIAAVATSAAEGREKAAVLEPDVALVDLGLPDYEGVELARRLRLSSPSTKVVVLTGNIDSSLFPRAMAAGACGYLIKDASLAEVTDAIRRAHAGQVVVPERVVGQLADVCPPSKGIGSDLTKRELDVLRLLGEGSDARAIARSLDITWHTARTYVKTVLMKLDAHSQLEAVAKAIREGILKPRAFERPGTAPDVRRVSARPGDQPKPGAQATKTFMFTDIVGSTDLAQAIGDEAWDSILRWHDDSLRSLFAEHRGEEIKQTGDGFFVAFDEARPALACAIAIQQALAAHRREHGFSPQVRIGLHSAPATRRGYDYTGAGVNTAARIGALAGGGEILASAATATNESRTSDPRLTRLKGVKEPIEVVSISWH